MTGINGIGGTQKGSDGTTKPLSLKLRKHFGEIPKFADMKVKILYKSFNVNFPFCDFVYKDKQNGGLVCIQVSIEKDGHRKVEEGSFKSFCKYMGWEQGKPPEDVCDKISFVYCPLPILADKARVTFDAGIGISKYTVWHLCPDFKCGA
jgi:hypothetical protein